MADEIKKEDTKKVETSAKKTMLKVTSTVTIDFPSLDWGINAGATRELPVDEATQKIILSDERITIIK